MSARIALIAAMDQDRCIGVNNTLPWHISEDLKRFKVLTTGKPVIMGRKTFDSLGRPLPNRLNIVISRTPQTDTESVVWVDSLDAAFDRARGQNTDEIMVIGGAQIYTQALEYADRLYLTEVVTQVKGDAFFPAMGPDWQVVQREGPFTDEKSGLVYSYKTYEKQAVCQPAQIGL